ncbi:MAG: cytochrome c oxidase assembly protein [Verrucomicrobiota bacterium JB023]|nr:cytochrome c oxidase assembly protein [Verrucomicrobiota bacterium JB023]
MNGLIGCLECGGAATTGGFNAHKIIPPALAALFPVAYLTGLLIQRTRHDKWSGWRTAFFLIGSSLLIWALLPPIAGAAYKDPEAHMLQHLLIGMFAPLGLVLGAPVTLALRSVPVGVGRRFSRLMRAPVVHTLSHPVAALILNVGGMYVLYLTPLFALSMYSAPLHYLVHVHFLAAGCLFVWAIAGPDPAPRRPGMRTRLIVLFVGAAAHAILGKMLYIHGLPDFPLYDPAATRAAAKLMYYGGDLAEVLLAIALFSIWFRRRVRSHGG